jgi:hypothetical protein
MGQASQQLDLQPQEQYTGASSHIKALGTVGLCLSFQQPSETTNLSKGNTWQAWRLYPTATSLSASQSKTYNDQTYVSNPRGARPPTLDEVRGKAVLLRKFLWDNDFPDTPPGGRDSA